MLRGKKNQTHSKAILLIPIFILCLVSVGTSSLIMSFWTSISAVYAQKEEQTPPLPSCVSLDSESKRIFITCDATFADVKKEITDKSILKSEGGRSSSRGSRSSSSSNSGNFILDSAIILN